MPFVTFLRVPLREPGRVFDLARIRGALLAAASSSVPLSGTAPDLVSASRPDAARRPSDLPVPGFGDGLRHCLPGADPGEFGDGIMSAIGSGHGRGSEGQERARPRAAQDVGEAPAIQASRRRRHLECGFKEDQGRGSGRRLASRRAGHIEAAGPLRPTRHPGRDMRHDGRNRQGPVGRPTNPPRHGSE